MKSFIIGENDAGQRLDKFIGKAVKNLPQALIYKYIRKKRIKVNGKRGDIAYRLEVGDNVELYINDEFFAPRGGADFLAAPAKLAVVYEDKNILLADKKPGLVVHDDDAGAADTLIARIKHYLYDKKEYDPENELSFVPALCNRIDRNTGGIVLAAKNAESLRILNEKIKEREIGKFYLCLVCGRLEKKEGILSGFLKKDEGQRMVHIHREMQPGDLSARTGYRVLAEKNGLSLVEAELFTGRTHQIRAQFASIGHPLLGDGKYGVNAVNRKNGLKYQALYSYKTRFDFTADAGILNYLKGKTFEAEKVWFVEEFENGRFST